MIVVTAPAKINPLLTVGSSRSDGKHELVSVMQSISLADQVTLTDAPALAVTGVDVQGEDLAARAARTFAAARGRSPEVAIAIDKRIPMAAGLGGGSADAAATLVGLKALWDEAVSRKALEKIGASLGADVPFCIRGGTCVARGAGEDLDVLACPTPMWWILGIAAEGLSTAAVYAAFDDLGGGEVGDPWEVADALARGDALRLAGALRNDLEPAALSLVPGLAAGREALLAAGALRAILSGSGPTWLGLARDEEHARDVASSAQGFARVEVASSVGHGAKVRA